VPFFHSRDIGEYENKEQLRRGVDDEISRFPERGGPKVLAYDDSGHENKKKTRNFFARNNNQADQDPIDRDPAFFFIFIVRLKRCGPTRTHETRLQKSLCSN